MLRLIAATVLVTLCYQGQAAPAEKAAQVIRIPAPIQTKVVKYDFNNTAIAGIERRRLSKGFEVRGWKLGANVTIGQTKIGEKWGAGLVVDRGPIKYGINNRGLQVIRKF